MESKNNELKAKSSQLQRSQEENLRVEQQLKEQRVFFWLSLFRTKQKQFSFLKHLSVYDTHSVVALCIKLMYRTLHQRYVVNTFWKAEHFILLMQCPFPLFIFFFLVLLTFKTILLCSMNKKNLSIKTHSYSFMYLYWTMVAILFYF